MGGTAAGANVSPISIPVKASLYMKPKETQMAHGKGNTPNNSYTK